MYPTHEVMASKAHELIQLKLYPEALLIAKEISERWPEHPSGWSYLGEIYAYYFGLGRQAASAIKRGLSCPDVTTTVYHKTLLENSINFALDNDMLAKGIDGLLHYFPQSGTVPMATELRRNSNGVYSSNVLAEFHMQAATWKTDGIGIAIGAASAQWDLAVFLLEKMGDSDRQENALVCLIYELGNVDTSMREQREHYGMAFMPEDQHSLRYRVELFETFADDFFPNDPKMLNRWAASYKNLNDANNFDRITKRVLEIERYDRPLINKAYYLREKGFEHHCKGEFEIALTLYEEALSCLKEALRIGGEDSLQADARKYLNLCQYSIDTAKSGHFLMYNDATFESNAKGLKHLYEAEMREIILIKQGIHFTPKMAADAARQRLNLNDHKQADQCIRELLEDFNPSVASAVIVEFKTQGKKYDCCIDALLQIADNPGNCGAMSRIAMETFAMLLLKGNNMLDIHKSFKKYVDKLPPRKEIMLKSIALIFGKFLEESLKGYLKTSPTDLRLQEQRPFWKRIFPF